MKRSPTKKPKNDENASPSKESQYTSPVKKTNVSPNKGRSQRRRQRLESDDSVDQKYLTTDFEEGETDKKPCKLSPLKRMKRLEQQEKTEEETIETTYKSSPNKFVIKPNQTENPEAVEEEPKSLLTQTADAQDK